MKKIVLLSNYESDQEISHFLTHYGFEERPTSEQLFEVHYIVISRYLNLFELSNRIKDSDKCIDATSGNWKPKLMELLDQKFVANLYSYRPPINTLKKLESLRDKNGWSESQTVEFAVSYFFNNNNS